MAGAAPREDGGWIGPGQARGVHRPEWSRGNPTLQAGSVVRVRAGAGPRIGEAGDLLPRHDPAAMIAEALAIDPFGAPAIDLPRRAQLATGPAIARAAAFVMHESLLNPAPLRFDAGDFSRKWPEAKRAG